MPDQPTPLTVRATDSDAPKEKCGVVGIWNHPQAVNQAYMGLYAQQHRGQESAGLAVTDGREIEGYTGMGLVSEVFTARVLDDLIRAHRGSEPADGRDDHGRVGGAIGHNRYSTSGGSKSCNAQPIIETLIAGGASGWSETQVAVAHNGNLINAAALRHAFAEKGHLFHTTSDTEVMVHLLASPEQRDQEDPLAAMQRWLHGGVQRGVLVPGSHRGGPRPLGLASSGAGADGGRE
jgi:amidophosphoribosyltransferase